MPGATAGGTRGVTDAELLESAVLAARSAGEVLQDWRQRFTVSHKSCAADLVTEADHAAQKIIYDLLLARYPQHNFLGEEGLLATEGAEPFRWVIDPLDGTSNYVHGFPYYAVSIGVEREGELCAAAIFDPTRDELFTAVKGGGAHLNGVPLHVSANATLREAFLVASFPRAVYVEEEPIQRFLRVLPHAQTIQRTGSAALNLAYLAAGRLDGFWSSSLMPWDMAAGVLLVREAGGRVTRIDGSPIDIAIPDLLATNAQGFHDDLQALLTHPS